VKVAYVLSRNPLIDRQADLASRERPTSGALTAAKDPFENRSR
jgi:hypothetical protein